MAKHPKPKPEHPQSSDTDMRDRGDLWWKRHNANPPLRGAARVMRRRARLNPDLNPGPKK